MEWKSLPTFIFETDSKEELHAAYVAWFFPDKTAMAITKSGEMFFQSVIAQFKSNAITTEQAQLSESAFIMNGWQWADAPSRQLGKARFRDDFMKTLLKKKNKDDDED